MKPNKKTPPLAGEKILKLFLPAGERDSINGDYEELYTDIILTKGKFKAYIWFWIQILKSMWAGLSLYIWWSFAMFKNYLTIAFRNLKRHKVYSAINISGLAIGLACCILILLWINDEIRVDCFHKNADSLYRVVNDLNYLSYSQISPGCAYPLGPAMKEEIPEIADFTRFLPARKLLVAHGEKRYYEENFYFADSSFFMMFSFPFINGDPSTALSSPDSLVLTQKTAAKYFGNEDPIGKLILTNNQDEYKVTGIIEDIPQNSHLQFDFIGTIERAVALGARTHWTGWLYRTYILLRPDISFREVNKKLEAWIQTKDSQAARYYLQPLKNVNMYGLTGEGAIHSLSIFSMLALLVLAVACINYMNLATARAGSRAKEIGIRKVIGASKKSTLKQFLIESIIFAFFALFISFLLVYLFLPVFNHLAGKQMNMNLVQNKFLFLGIFGITLFTGFLAGSYPAFFISSFQPSRILKGTYSPLKIARSKFSIRKILVTSQFILSIILIISTIVVYKQMEYIQNRKLGFEKEHLVYIQLRGGGNLWERDDSEKLWQKYKTLKYELSQDPNIMDITASTCVPFRTVGSEMGQLEWPGKDPEYNLEMNHMAVDHNFLNTFKLEMVSGRFFSEEFNSDSNNFVLNETALSAIGLDSPLGKKFRLLGKTGEIIGVIKDFHFASLHNEIKPLILHLMPYQYWQYRNYVFVRVNSNNFSKPIASMEKIWDRVIPEYPFEFSFLDETIDNLYRSEQRLGKILSIFAFLVIFISCFGLFGLISFTAEQRTKEIGIRKVLGASVVKIIRLLSKEFLILVVLANLFAWPMAYFIMRNWLDDFAYHTNMSLTVFLFSSCMALIIALLTASYQSIKAGIIDPVDSLRYE